MEMKEKLGLTSAKEQTDGYAALQTLKKKFETWRKENQVCRTMRCPYCSKEFLMKLRTEAWEVQKHPFFQDKIVGNKHLIVLYKEGKLTKNDLALVFETSPDYIEWLIERWKMPLSAEEAAALEGKKTIVTEETNTLPPAGDSVRESSQNDAPATSGSAEALEKESLDSVVADGFPSLEGQAKEEEVKEVVDESLGQGLLGHKDE